MHINWPHKIAIAIGLSIFSLNLKAEIRAEKEIFTGIIDTQQNLAIAEAHPIVVIGDTQRTLGIEKVFFRREKNDEERNLILKYMMAEDPSLIIHLGDLVARGNSQKSWDLFEELIGPIFELEVPILPALGNHEYWGRNSKAGKHLYQYFPMFKEVTWYHRILPNGIAVIWLNSNTRPLSDLIWEEQSLWFNQKLIEMKNDSKVKGIIVVAHHPPFTNSLLIPDHKELKKWILPGFLAHPKTLAFLSGHAHGYEHFIEQGKHLIVSGGGGGPRTTYLPKDKARHQDVYQEDVKRRSFNYIRIDYTDTDISFAVKGFQKGETELKILDYFSLPINGTFSAK